MYFSGQVNFFTGHCYFEIDPEGAYVSKRGTHYHIDTDDVDYMREEFVVSEYLQEVMMDCFDIPDDVYFDIERDTLNYDWFQSNCTSNDTAQKAYDLCYDEFKIIIDRFAEFCDEYYESFCHDLYTLEQSNDLD